jgi:hypothetical protein
LKAMKSIGWCSSDSFSRYLREHMQILTAHVQVNSDLQQRIPYRQTTASCSPSAVLFSPTIRDNGPCLVCHKRNITNDPQLARVRVPHPARARKRCALCRFWMYTLLLSWYLCHNTFISIAPIDYGVPYTIFLVMHSQYVIASPLPHHHRPRRGFSKSSERHAVLALVKDHSA